MSQKVSVSLETDSLGAATGYAPAFHGLIHQIWYEKTDFADNFDITVTLETTGYPVLLDVTGGTASRNWVPRQVAQGPADGNDIVDFAEVANAGERVKVVIANGGDTKAGKIHIWYT